MPDLQRSVLALIEFELSRGPVCTLGPRSPTRLAETAYAALRANPERLRCKVRAQKFAHFIHGLEQVPLERWRELHPLRLTICEDEQAVRRTDTIYLLHQQAR